MAHAEKCPVCNGVGKVRIKKEGDLQTCHGCGGLGWITVGAEYPVIYPINPTYPPYADPWWPYSPPNWTCPQHWGNYTIRYEDAASKSEEV